MHQGLLLEADPLPSPELGDLPTEGIVLLLDQITDPHNVGAILRSAAAFDAVALVTQDRHAPPEGGVVAKSASGALDLYKADRFPHRWVHAARLIDEPLHDATLFRHSGHFYITAGIQTLRSASYDALGI